MGANIRQNVHDVSTTTGLFYINSFTRKFSFQYDPTLKIKNQSDDDNLFWCMRHMLRFGRLIGVFPFSGTFHSDHSRLIYRLYSAAGVWTLFCDGCIFLALSIGVLGIAKLRGTNATEWAWAADSAAFYLTGHLCYFHFLRRGDKLIQIFYRWSYLPLHFRVYDKTLKRDILLSGFILLSGILENLVWTYNGFVDFVPPNDGSSMLRNFFENSRTQWLNIVDYTSILPLFILFSNKLCMWAWNLTDIFLISMARALYGKFKVFNEVARLEIIRIPIKNNKALEHTKEYDRIELLLKDHQLLRSLLEEISQFLSPLVFHLYTGSLFFICLQIHLGVTSEAKRDFWGSLYALWSFMHLLIKLFMITLTASKVNYYVHRFADILYEIPDHLETNSVRKTRAYLGSKSIGLNGLGCFIVRTPFMLSLLSFVFTFEIVLFQSTFPSCVTPGNGTFGVDSQGLE